MKFLVLGATGFLGSHLARTLLAEGHEVCLLSRSGGIIAASEEQPALKVEAIDLFDFEGIQTLAQGVDGAFLCTGLVSRDKSAAEKMHRLHVEGTQAALEALKQAGVPKVVVASTSGTIAVGEDPEEIFDEQSVTPLKLIAAWPYYRSKYYGEEAALRESTPGFEVVIVNPSLLLGPGDLRESSTGDIRRFLEKSIMASPTGGIAFVDVRDAALGMLRAFESGRAKERYLLNGANMTVKAFFERLSRMTGISAPRFSLPKNKLAAATLFSLYESTLKKLGGTPPIDAESVEIGQYFWYCSSEKAEQQLGFISRDPGATLHDTVNDLLERHVVAPVELRRD